MAPIDKLSWIHIQDRKVLFVRTRGNDRFYTPGGKREGNESDEQALMREIKEELFVDLVPDTIRYLETFVAQAAGKPEGVMVQIRCFEAEYRGTLAPSGEIEELGWLATADAERTSPTGILVLEYLRSNDRID